MSIQFLSEYDPKLAHGIFSILRELGIENWEVELSVWCGSRTELTARGGGWYVVAAETRSMSGKVLGLCTQMPDSENGFLIHILESDNGLTLRHELRHAWQALRGFGQSEIDAESFARRIK